MVLSRAVARAMIARWSCAWTRERHADEDPLTGRLAMSLNDADTQHQRPRN